MNHLSILKYICSYDDVPKGIDNNSLLIAQEHYYKSPRPIIFDPLNWFCFNLKDIIEHIKCIYTDYEETKPCSILFNGKTIFHNNLIKEKALETICELYITKFPETKNYENEFDSNNFYMQYFQQIELFWQFYGPYYEQDTFDKYKPYCFFIIYGYWYDLHPSYLEPNVLLASNPFLIQDYTSETILEHYYSNKEIFNKTLQFCPLTYLATHIENHKIMETFVSKNCSYCIFPNLRILRHYIRHGYSEKLSYNGFNHMNFLANNHTKIKNLMKRNKHGKIVWDLYNLTNDKIAREYLKLKVKSKKIKQNNFDPIKFLKAYIDDNIVNKNRKLNVENAAEYFVKYYVLSKYLRYKTTYTSKCMDFIQGRAVDSMKQIPLNASRFLIEAKCL